MAREIRQAQHYTDRLLKLIPSEIVAAYMVLQGIVPADASPVALILISGVLLVLTPLYLWRLQHVRRLWQLAVTTVSFAVWVYTLGGPFERWGIYEPWIGSVVLVVWTVTVPLLLNPQPARPGGGAAAGAQAVPDAS